MIDQLPATFYDVEITIPTSDIFTDLEKVFKQLSDRDANTAKHLNEVAGVTREVFRTLSDDPLGRSQDFIAMGERYGVDSEKLVWIAALMHDIGKFADPEIIKYINIAGPLDTEQKRYVAKHNEKGADVIAIVTDKLLKKSLDPEELSRQRFAGTVCWFVAMYHHDIEGFEHLRGDIDPEIYDYVRDILGLVHFVDRIMAHSDTTRLYNVDAPSVSEAGNKLIECERNKGMYIMQYLGISAIEIIGIVVNTGQRYRDRLDNSPLPIQRTGNPAERIPTEGLTNIA